MTGSVSLLSERKHVKSSTLTTKKIENPNSRQGTSIYFYELFLVTDLWTATTISVHTPEQLFIITYSLLFCDSKVLYFLGRQHYCDAQTRPTSEKRKTS